MTCRNKLVFNELISISVKTVHLAKSLKLCSLDTGLTACRMALIRFFAFSQQSSAVYLWRFRFQRIGTASRSRISLELLSKGNSWRERGTSERATFVSNSLRILPLARNSDSRSVATERAGEHQVARPGSKTYCSESVSLLRTKAINRKSVGESVKSDGGD